MNRSMAQPWVFPLVPFQPPFFVEEFESKGISTALIHPDFCIRYVMTPLSSNRQYITFSSYTTSISLTHIYILGQRFPAVMDPSLSWTPGPNNTLLTSVYRKPIHTYQCLPWDSCHNLSAKYSIFNTLTHRVRTVCTNAQLLQRGEEHIRRAIHRWKYPICVLNRLQTISNHINSINQPQNNKNNTNNNHSTSNYNNTNNSNSNNKSIHMVVPYTKGLCESFKNVVRWGPKSISKEATLLGTSWWHPRIGTTSHRKVG